LCAKGIDLITNIMISYLMITRTPKNNNAQSVCVQQSVHTPNYARVYSQVCLTKKGLLRDLRLLLFERSQEFANRASRIYHQAVGTD
jgi:hypothetical protein